MAFVTFPHPALEAAATPRDVDDALRATGQRLLAALIEAEAYGLAAAHIGEPEPVIAINLAPPGPERDDQLFYNPRILAFSGEEEAGPEASVSLPGISVPISRPVEVEIDYDDAEGVRHTERFEDFAARCIFHEIEQMNGRFFLDNLSRLKRETALKKFKKASRLDA